MGFQHPELLLLALPAALGWWLLRSPSNATNAVRALLFALGIVALAGAYLKTRSQGRDLVIVADRSRSMTRASLDAELELTRLVEEARREGDRVAIVSFGARGEIERLPSSTDRFARFERDVDADGSDIGRALELALDLIPPERPGSIVLVSDGEHNGRDPIPAARRAFGRGVRVDTLSFPRQGRSDLSVERIDLPEDVALFEPFQFSVWVRADKRGEADFTLQRGERMLSSGRRVFEQGLNRIVLRDVLDESGIAGYRVALDSGGDRVPENDVAVGALRVQGARSILVVNDDGQPDALVAALRAAQLPVKVSSPEAARLDAISLTAHRGVILENVAASRISAGFQALASFVTEDGGGLMLTGGKASFGTGGYFKSRLDKLLPVSMEMRQEHRKQAIALSIALDRSGSMAASVGVGMTKMDLADLGACAAIELLSPIDSVGVIAVDSAHHVIQPLVPVTDVPELTARVRTIQSSGGGIYCYTALLAAGKMLEEASQTTRHVILFADAADADEQENCAELVQQMVRAGITTSVIGLGSEADIHADFLKMVAKLGEGNCYFSTDPMELPRLFAQDTMTVARATFIEEATACAVLPDLFGLGELPGKDFAQLGGYNLTYLRNGAVPGIVTQDQYQAPVFAFMQQGLGRTAAFTGQIGGTFGASVIAWPGFAGFFVSIARWLAGQEEPNEVFASVHREGREAVVTVEIEPDAAGKIDPKQLALTMRAAESTTSAPQKLVLERVGENRYEARFPLVKEGIALGTLALPDKRLLHLPPVVLPYSPEFEHGGDTERGERLLREISAESGGLVNTSALEMWRGGREGKGWRPILRELLLVILALLLIEIAARRLELWEFVRLPAPVVRAWARVRARREPSPSISTPAAQGSESKAAGIGDSDAGTRASRPTTRLPTAKTMESALDKARRAADRRLDR